MSWSLSSYLSWCRSLDALPGSAAVTCPSVHIFIMCVPLCLQSPPTHSPPLKGIINAVMLAVLTAPLISVLLSGDPNVNSLGSSDPR